VCSGSTVQCGYCSALLTPSQGTILEAWSISVDSSYTEVGKSCQSELGLLFYQLCKLKMIEEMLPVKIKLESVLSLGLKLESFSLMTMIISTEK
jgi:hypothetical protein